MNRADNQNRTGELSIGIVCACLPTVNILLERGASRQGTGQHRGPRNIESTNKKKSKGSSARLSSWLSSKLTTITTATTTTNRDQPTTMEHTTVIHQVNVDVELGTITETVGEEEMDITRGQGRSGRTRVMSVDGRREGWLAPLPGQEPRQQQQSKSSSNHNGHPTRVEVEVVAVEEDNNNVPPWDFIWDGRRTAFTETRLQDLRHQRPP